MKQLLNGTIPSMQMNIAQFTFLIVILTPYMIIKQHLLPSSNTGFLIAIVIGVLKCVNYYCVNLAVLYMPVGTSSTEMSIVFLLCILGWTAGCSRQFTSRGIIVDTMAVMLIIVGVVLVVQPPWLFTNVSAPNVTVVTVCTKAQPPEHSKCYLTSSGNEANVIDQTIYDTNMMSHPGVDTKVEDDDDRPMWKGQVFIVIFGVSSTACLILLSKGAQYIGNAELIYWSAVTANILSILSLALYQPCELYIPETSVCMVIWVLHAACGGLTGLFGNVAVILLPHTDFGVISSLSTVNLFVLQFTVLTRIKPAILNVESVSGAVMICGVTFAKPILRAWTHPTVSEDEEVEATFYDVGVEHYSEKDRLVMKRGGDKDRRTDPNIVCLGCF